MPVIDQRVQLVIILLKGDLRREFTPNELAQAVNLSASRLQHLFKLETGTTLVHYRRLLRLNEARRLLETSLLSIKEIRTSVGINERGHFGRKFKSLYGVTPSQYRTTAYRSKGDGSQFGVAGLATE